MAETTAMPSVHLHYWAGARAAAGTASEEVEATTVRQALERAAAGRDARFSRVVAACSLLVDGLAAHDADLDAPLLAPVQVEVLPPFAGGSRP
jgi:molybdopterin synthase sulfur carrier subunit